MKLKQIISSIFIPCVLIIGLSFAFINANPVVVDYYLGKISISLSLLLILTLGIGIFFGFLSNFVAVLKLKKENYFLKHSIKQIEKENSPPSTTPLN